MRTKLEQAVAVAQDDLLTLQYSLEFTEKGVEAMAESRAYDYSDQMPKLARHIQLLKEQADCVRETLEEGFRPSRAEKEGDGEDGACLGEQIKECLAPILDSDGMLKVEAVIRDLLEGRDPDKTDEAA